MERGEILKDATVQKETLEDKCEVIQIQCVDEPVDLVACGHSFVFA